MRFVFNSLSLSQVLSHSSSWANPVPVRAALGVSAAAAAAAGTGQGGRGEEEGLRRPHSLFFFAESERARAVGRESGEGKKGPSGEGAREDVGRAGGGTEEAVLLQLDAHCEILRPAPCALLLISRPSKAAAGLHGKSCRSYFVQCASEEAATEMHASLEYWQRKHGPQAAAQPKSHNTKGSSPQGAKAGAQADGAGSAGGAQGAAAALEWGSQFDSKIEASSAKMYFHYYGQLLHQQNMLQDYVRTGTYYAAVLENKVDFDGKVVVDVGAGSGILSLFAAKAGAKKVYAIEASSMAHYAAKLAAGNPSIGQAISIVHGKVEDITLPEKADVLISEPMGTLLVNERMLETYIIARDNFLKPGGKMFPGQGRIHVAPFSDEYLYVEMANKALFWQQRSYYGVDLMPLHADALQGYFAQPVVDAFDPRILISPSISHTIDFNTVKEQDLFEIDIPLGFQASMAARVHGLACWFDVLFEGSMVQRWLSTAPGSPTTHWYQLRCVLAQPLYVFAGQHISGRLHLVAHSAQSFTIFLTMSTHAWSPPGSIGTVLQTSTGKLDLKEPYYRISQASLAWTQEQPQVQQATQQQQQQHQQQHQQQQQQQQQQHQQQQQLYDAQVEQQALAQLDGQVQMQMQMQMQAPSVEAEGEEGQAVAGNASEQEEMLMAQQQQQQSAEQAVALQRLMLQHQPAMVQGLHHQPPPAALQSQGEQQQ